MLLPLGQSATSIVAPAKLTVYRWASPSGAFEETMRPATGWDQLVYFSALRLLAGRQEGIQIVKMSVTYP